MTTDYYREDDAHCFYTLYLLNSWAKECERTSAKVAAALRRLMSDLMPRFMTNEAAFKGRLDEMHYREAEGLDEDVGTDSYDENREIDLFSRPGDMPEKDLVAMLRDLLGAKMREAASEAMQWSDGKSRKQVAYWKVRQEEHRKVLDAFDAVFGQPQ